MASWTDFQCNLSYRLLCRRVSLFELDYPDLIHIIDYFFSRPIEKSVMNSSTKHIWDGTERRKPYSCRRVSGRRTKQERRCDRRNAAEKNSRSLIGWLRSFAKARLGVDRRKIVDRRTISNQRRFNSRSLLTREELTDLLK